MKFCYVTLLFCHNNKCDYLEGVILTGLGLRKQNVKYKMICLVTPDVSKKDREIILEIWDKIIEIEYISPVKELNGIIINEKFFNPDYKKNNNSWLKVFTKMHIFNKNILPYDKVLFVDSDLIPIKDFDNIFNEYDTPAGWLELVIANKNNTFNITWGEHVFNDNEIIDSAFTDISQGPFTINAGLLLVKPDKNTFDEIIIELKSDSKIESIDLDGIKKSFYWCPEQAYLTKKFSGEWHYINHFYNSWGYHNDKCKSLHMAGLFYIINNKKVNAKTWQIQNKTPDCFNIKTNEIGNWGIQKYKNLENILFKNLKII